MSLNIENLVRSGVVLAIGLPIVLSVNGVVNTGTQLARQAAGDGKASTVQQDFKGQLTRDCLVFAMTDIDSKLEREAKNNIDDIFGGEADHKAACQWALG